MTLVVAVIAQLFIVSFIYQQMSGIKALSDDWEALKNQYVQASASLVKVERGFGYVGFIHHFKNYIIRRSPNYYNLALDSQSDIFDALQELKRNPSIDNQDRESIQVLVDILVEYARQLSIAKNTPLSTSTEALDELIKVDDERAARALERLRDSILANNIAGKMALNNQVAQMRISTGLMGFSLIPLFLFSTYITIITLRSQATNLKELTAIYDSSPDGIIYVDSKGMIKKANQAALDIFGYSRREFCQLNIEALVEESVREQHAKMRRAFIQEQGITPEKTRESLPVKGVKKDGSTVELSVTVESKIVGKQMAAVCLIKDLTLLKTLQEHSNLDHLTQVSNRRHLDDVLTKEVSRARRNNRAASLLLIDMDNFKRLNDECGHIAGDYALQKVAKFLVNSSRECDYVCRWGGDEFVIFCPDQDSAHAHTFAERLRTEYERLTAGDDVRLTLSIGIADTNSIATVSPKDLIDAADRAVYSAKNAGRNRAVRFDSFGLMNQDEMTPA
ncbi:sensor domain-containing diguanylate cyclase [Vibrio agarivorans]|uniref:diguanylate cyclase n=1 Tax=Vibrio agarivorans TaxID=153622 RepID=A0ABT7Y4Q4_9VIBR|nr:sensor domain-containing diguanylate cyclase [Vibrio agarivorans]MDN2482956.1 sensor domain-containing diguanylate cyclase [Vibrio agarivorans]